jgi:hypothetical protein
MRDPATINAICWMIRNRRQVADIPNTCGGQAGLSAAIRRVCEEGQVCFDQKTESLLFEGDQHNIRWCVPDWDALEEVVKVFCVSEG